MLLAGQNEAPCFGVIDAAGTAHAGIARLARAVAAIARSRITLLAVAAVVVFYRRPGVFERPQFWAEDGKIFFRHNIVLGARAIFRPYPGYMNLIPRIVAWCAGRLPCVYAPRLYGLAALAMLLFVVWQLAGSRFPLRFRRAAALAPVLVAHGGEVFLNLTNVQWFSGLLLIFLLIAKEPCTRRTIAADFTTMLLAGLTGPFLILFAPLFAFRFLLYGRSRYNDCLFAAALLLALVQGCTLCCSEKHPTVSIGESARPIRLAEYTFQTVFASGSGVQFVGDYMTAGGPSREVAATVAVGAWLLILSQRGRRRRQLAALLLLAGALVAAAAVYQARNDVPGLWCLVHNPPGGDRYRYLLRVMQLWGLLLVLEGGGWRRLAAAALLGWCVYGSAHFFRAAGEPDCHWPEYAARIDRGEAVDVPIVPSWVFHLDGTQRKEKQDGPAAWRLARRN